MNNNELEKLEIEWLNEERIKRGFKPLPKDVEMDKKSQHVVLVSNESWEKLGEIARDLGFSWGPGRGSVGRLLEAIGQGLYELEPRSYRDD